MYVASVLAPLGVSVTRLASGLPVGGDLEYADELTLGRALAAAGTSCGTDTAGGPEKYGRGAPRRLLGAGYVAARRGSASTVAPGEGKIVQTPMRTMPVMLQTSRCNVK